MADHLFVVPFRGPPMSIPALVAWVHTTCLIRILICDLGPTCCRVSCQHMSVAFQSCALTQQVHFRTRFHSNDSGHELRPSLQVFSHCTTVQSRLVKNWKQPVCPSIGDSLNERLPFKMLLQRNI